MSADLYQKLIKKETKDGPGVVRGFRTWFLYENEQFELDNFLKTAIPQEWFINTGVKWSSEVCPRFTDGDWPIMYDGREEILYCGTFRGPFSFFGIHNFYHHIFSRPSQRKYDEWGLSPDNALKVSWAESMHQDTLADIMAIAVIYEFGYAGNIKKAVPLRPPETFEVSEVCKFPKYFEMIKSQDTEEEYFHRCIDWLLKEGYMTYEDGRIKTVHPMINQKEDAHINFLLSL
jgi:hypothetical protein